MVQETEITKAEPTEIQGKTPADLIHLAVTCNTDLDKLEKVMNLQERWENTEARKAYVQAMAKFKENPPKIVKDKAVNFGAGKAAFKHASLANICDKINEGLSAQGLSAAWDTKQNGGITVTCKITHKQGHSEETTLTAQADTSGSKNSIQAIGSTITYLQRYSLTALTGLAAGDHEDDGVGSEPAAAPKVIDNAQVGTIRDYIASLNASEEKFLKYMGIPSIEEMPQAAYQKAINLFKTKEKK